PVSHVSSTINTRFPVTRRGGPASTTGRAPLSVRVMATEAKSRCRMLATTAPGMTPALAIPMTTSGSYPRKTFSASARHSSPKNGQSTSRTPCGALRPVRVLLGGGVLGEAGMGWEATLQSHEAASYFRRMGFWRRLFGGSGAHYGLAFLLLKRGDPDGAAQHLRAFLAQPPRGPDAQKWIEHASEALRDLGASGPTQPAAAEAP